MAVRVVQVGAEMSATVFGLVARLLEELGEEGRETGALDRTGLERGWRAEERRQFAFLALAPDGSAVGVTTVAETFAIYAQGHYGIIHEMYVVPEHRSAGVGAQLIGAVKSLGRARGWRRIDVTAPESAIWSRTRTFYERQGFVFAGPKLKCVLSQGDVPVVPEAG